MFYWLNTLGYSMINSHPNWIGHLTLPQVYGLLKGFSSLESKKAEAVKKDGKSGGGRSVKGGTVERKSVANIHQLKGFPGVQRVKKR